MNTSAYANLHDMYIDTLARVDRQYQFVTQPRGFLEKEILGFSAQITDPADRYCYFKERKQNIVFNYAEALWYLSGKNDLEFIQYYAPRMARYSADGETLPGTGYGPKLLSFGANSLDQISRAVDILRNDDPDSKRVFLQIFDANENIYRENIDVSCTLGLQLMLREGSLHMVAYMRANDAFIGMLSDIFSFTFIQELLASMIGCKLGSYHHTVGSIHIYQSNYETVETLLSDNTRLPAEAEPNFRMPLNSSLDDIKAVLKNETLIRRGGLDGPGIEALRLADYWKELLRLFLIHKYVKDEKPVPKEILDRLRPIHKVLASERWQKLAFGKNVGVHNENELV